MRNRRFRFFSPEESGGQAPVTAPITAAGEQVQAAASHVGAAAAQNPAPEELQTLLREVRGTLEGVGRELKRANDLAESTRAAAHTAEQAASETAETASETAAPAPAAAPAVETAVPPGAGVRTVRRNGRKVKRHG